MRITARFGSLSLLVVLVLMGCAPGGDDDEGPTSTTISFVYSNPELGSPDVAGYLEGTGTMTVVDGVMTSLDIALKKNDDSYLNGYRFHFSPTGAGGGAFLAGVASTTVHWGYWQLVQWEDPIPSEAPDELLWEISLDWSGGQLAGFVATDHFEGNQHGEQFEYHEPGKIKAIRWGDSWDIGTPPSYYDAAYFDAFDDPQFPLLPTHSQSFYNDAGIPPGYDYENDPSGVDYQLCEYTTDGQGRLQERLVAEYGENVDNVQLSYDGAGRVQTLKVFEWEGPDGEGVWRLKVQVDISYDGDDGIVPGDALMEPWRHFVAPFLYAYLEY